jgi:hypothetical protein
MPASLTKFQEVYFHGRSLPTALVQCFEDAAIVALLAELGVRVLDPDAKPALLTGSYLSAEDQANPDIASNVVAIERILAKAAWFCETEDGNLFGYWLGDNNQWPALPIIVQYDTEGQFSCEGAIGLGDLLAADGCLGEDDNYATLAQKCEAAGLLVTLKILPDYYARECPIDPNAMRSTEYYAERVKRGLPGAE